MPKTLISTQKGFVIFYYIDHSGRRVIEWHRSSLVSLKSIKHLEKIIGKLPVDVIKIVFSGRIQIDENALNYLMSKYEVLLERSLQEKIQKPETYDFYNGKIVLITNKMIRVGEADKVPLNNEKDVWLLIISLGSDGKIRVFDENPLLLQNIISEAQRRDDRILVLALWHGKQKTYAYLVYPP